MGVDQRSNHVGWAKKNHDQFVVSDHCWKRTGDRSPWRQLVMDQNYKIKVKPSGAHLGKAQAMFFTAMEEAKGDLGELQASW